MSRLPHLIVVLLLVSGAHGWASQTVTITPSADTTLFERDPNNNWGKQSDLVAGSLGGIASGQKSRALLAFDIAGNIPAGSTITAVELRMRVVRVPSGGGENSTFQLLRAFLPWIEGLGNNAGIPGGTAANNGETTWGNQVHPSTPWTAPGGKFEVDYAEDPSATQFVSGLGDKIFTFNPLGVFDVQSMLDAPADNHGWVLTTQSEAVQKSARRWGAREHPTDPPSLTITFTPPPTSGPLEILSTEIDSSGDVVVEFHAIAGETYNLQTRTDLSTGDWITVETGITGEDCPVTVSTTPPANSQRLFFRITRD